MFRKELNKLNRAAMGIVLIASTFGCSAARNDSRQPKLLLTVYDCSETFKNSLEDALSQAATLAVGFDSSDTTIISCRVDGTFEEIDQCPAPDRIEDFKLRLWPMLKKPSTKRNTYLRPVFEELVKRAGDGTDDVVINLYTDFYEEGMSEADVDSVSRDAAQLAALPNVRIVCVVGIAPERRLEARRQLAALDASHKLLFANVTGDDEIVAEATEKALAGGRR